MADRDDHPRQSSTAFRESPERKNALRLRLPGQVLLPARAVPGDESTAGEFLPPVRLALDVSRDAEADLQADIR